MPSPAEAPVRAGDVIAGKYRVEQVLGAGGMGVVVAAVHLQLRQRVAIKFLSADLTSSDSATERFLREAQAAARIRSEHVAGVLDVATLENGTSYMVMEFLEGRDLGKLLEEQGPLPLAKAVGYMLEACEGVAEAHAVGIVHRDLKPANLFLCERGGGRTLVKVLDFGISKATTPGAGGDPTLTKTSALMGSPLYMSPEQMLSAKNVDARTDIWSLGVALFELVTHQRPFDGETVTELIANVLQRPAREVRQVFPDASPGFDAALARALEKERDRRYQNIAEFAQAIAPFGPPHASLSVEKILLALRSSKPEALELQATQHAPVAAAVGRPPLPRQGPHPPGRGTTTKPVSNEVSAWGEPRPKRPAKAGAAVIAGTVVLALGAAGTWRLVGHGSSTGSTTGQGTLPSLRPIWNGQDGGIDAEARVATSTSLIDASVGGKDAAPESGTVEPSTVSGAGPQKRNPGRPRPKDIFDRRE